LDKGNLINNMGSRFMVLTKKSIDILISMFPKSGFGLTESAKLVNTVEQSVNGARINISVEEGVRIRKMAVAWQKITSAKKISELTAVQATAIVKLVEETG
jgi:hypothetical protein